MVRPTCSLWKQRVLSLWITGLCLSHTEILPMSCSDCCGYLFLMNVVSLLSCIVICVFKVIKSNVVTNGCITSRLFVCLQNWKMSCVPICKMWIVHEWIHKQPGIAPGWAGNRQIFVLTFKKQYLFSSTCLLSVFHTKTVCLLVQRKIQKCWMQNLHRCWQI